MLYVIYSEDIPNSLEKRRQARPAHIERLQALKEQGRVLLAGPFPAIDSEEPGDAGMTGSLVIAEFESLAEATRWADVDPYMLAGVYQKVTVKPFKKTI
ncbi:YciI family protein [Rahnella sp. SAP-1]|jgi:uncharacterized protein YciI|uniref:YciI family protein n=1 Tax=Rouxiella aceris TaxID=2703884 RepID=A0A848MK93_9GAMM|nr:YciI family protein [Rouxiella aceris]NMP28737.1 YciI family protein [Rouxiella aceris]